MQYAGVFEAVADPSDPRADNIETRSGSPAEEAYEMKSRTKATRRRDRSKLLAGLAALAASMVMAVAPAIASHNSGAGQYEPSAPPGSGSEDPAPAPAPSDTSEPAPAPAPAEAPTDTGTSSEATGTVTEDPTSTVESLPVTGLAAAPLAIAGLVLLLLGSLGLRRYTPEADEKASAGDGLAVLDGPDVLDRLRPTGAVAVLDRRGAEGDTVAFDAVEAEEPAGDVGLPDVLTVADVVGQSPEEDLAGEASDEPQPAAAAAASPDDTQPAAAPPPEESARAADAAAAGSAAIVEQPPADTGGAPVDAPPIGARAPVRRRTDGAGRVAVAGAALLVLGAVGARRRR